MTSRMIHHDFRNNNPVSTTKSTSGVSLTAAVLAKGRRLAAISQGLQVVCLTLCGACIGVSLLILTNLILG